MGRRGKDRAAGGGVLRRGRGSRVPAGSQRPKRAAPDDRMARSCGAHRARTDIKHFRRRRPDTLIQFLEVGEQDLTEEPRAPATEILTAAYRTQQTWECRRLCKRP